MDFRSLKKIEGGKPRSTVAESDSDEIPVIAELHEGAAPPPYVKLRMSPVGGIFTALIRRGELPKLQADAAIKRVQRAKPEQLID